MKNNYMRNPLAMEVFNEELCSLLKRRIKDSVFRRDDLSIAFHYAGEVALEESEAILRKVTAVHKRVLAAADRAHDPERALALRAFAANAGKILLRIRTRFLSTKRLADCGRRDQPDSRFTRAVADVSGNLLFPKRQSAPAQNPRPEPAAK
jgi:hypothetical protein